VDENALVMQFKLPGQQEMSGLGFFYRAVMITEAEPLAPLLSDNVSLAV